MFHTSLYTDIVSSTKSDKIGVSFSILLLKMTFSPEDKKIIKNLTNAVKALVIIFFIPMLISLVMYMLGENNDISRC